ncbi:SGNH/GDSL hydrolase family protein [Bradyrhizobium erythrophlei]|uniref:Lysophospholipase L1 n=1 Tax=Bradyrhizobium erythrophlei TaxID=1437360 RepID=A0A1M5UGN5_9BRAD|nr:SGNH/GDSL hydrolase family protein [Bradyrhizobium erythrophlei]SHH62068.1 Lysophospholipase L1 [Bradyrhizobium erythrophlei]
MKMSRWSLILFVLIVSNVATGYVVKKNAPPKVDPQRDMLNALTRMSDIRTPFVVILGDSITQNARLPDSICGMPLINAGVGGSRASTFIPFAEEMEARNISPFLVVLALGTNDTVLDYRTNFASAYKLLIDSLPHSPIALATLPPNDRSAPDAIRRNPSALSSVDQAIRDMAATRKAPLIDLGKIVGLKTHDGIHPTAATYPLWNKAIVDGIEGAMSCKGVTAEIER